jgi:hypothetical protein
MRSSTILVASLLLCAAAPHARGQDRPFVFSMITAPEASKPTVALVYDVGVGDTAFSSTQSNGPEQRIAVQASIGRWTFVGRVGTALTDATYQTSQQGEVLYSLFTQASSGVAVAVGGGMLREPGGSTVALARVVAGREFGAWRLHGNLLFQKATATGRDPLDLVTTVGWARRLGGSVSLGVEGIAEDVEGFWDPAEAEGGARLLVGPSLHVAPAGRRWQFSVAGGPMFHPSDTGRRSGALRDLPQSGAARSYAFRTSFGCTF